MKTKHRSRKISPAGFTLVELLVVIGIIALLISILLPSLIKARRAAEEVVCQSDIRQFGVGAQIYANQNNGSLPQKGPDGSDSGTNSFAPSGGVLGYDDPTVWFNAIPPLVNGKGYYDMMLDYHNNGTPLPHADVKSIFTCPMQLPPVSNHDVIAAGGDFYLLYGIDGSGTLKNELGMAGQNQFPWAATYVWNSKLGNLVDLTTGANVLGTPVDFIKMSDCSPASEVVLMTEKMTNMGEYTDKAVQQYNKSFPAVYQGKITSQGYDNKFAQTKADYHRFTTRHRSGGYLLFADGHVGWFRWVDVQPSPIQARLAVPDANNYGSVRWSALGPVN